MSQRTRRGPRKVSRDETCRHTYQGYRFIKGIRKLLARLASHKDCANRLLHYDEYATLLLFYFFNANITSLRGLRSSTEFEKVRKKLGIKRTSLGSLSEASNVFDPALLREVFLELSGQAAASDALPRPESLPKHLDFIVSDGSVLEGVPRMVWALWLRSHDTGVKVHLDYDVLRGVPTDVDFTVGCGSETESLRSRLEANKLYVLDRGYADYGFFQCVLDAKSSLLCRVQSNAVCNTIEERAVSDEARALGVQSDEIVMLGGKKSGKKLTRPVRVVKATITNKPSRSLRPYRRRVSSRKCFRTTSQTHELVLATDLLDVPAEMIVELYRHRWQVELFFKWLKCTLSCRHLIAESPEGVAMQVYAALIVSLLIVLWTGKKPTKRTLEMLQMYFQGWVSEQEFDAHIEKLKAA